MSLWYDIRERAFAFDERYNMLKCYIDSVYKRACDKIEQMITPPVLTDVSIDGTKIGDEGWTGTGFVCTDSNTKYSVVYNGFSDIEGYNRFSLKPKKFDFHSELYTPYLDLDGIEYEFFYSPSRGLYEALIPATTKNAKEIVSLIRWEKHKPTKMFYGDLSGIFSYSEEVNGVETELFKIKNELSVRYSKCVYGESFAKIFEDGLLENAVLVPASIGVNIQSLIFIAADVLLEGDLTSDALSEIQAFENGTEEKFTVDLIDNF